MLTGVNGLVSKEISYVLSYFLTINGDSSNNSSNDQENDYNTDLIRAFVLFKSGLVFDALFVAQLSLFKLVVVLGFISFGSILQGFFAVSKFVVLFVRFLHSAARGSSQ